MNHPPRPEKHFTLIDQLSAPIVRQDNIDVIPGTHLGSSLDSWQSGIEMTVVRHPSARAVFAHIRASQMCLNLREQRLCLSFQTL
jgi:hypothetical protein